MAYRRINNDFPVFSMEWYKCIVDWIQMRGISANCINKIIKEMVRKLYHTISYDDFAGDSEK